MKNLVNVKNLSVLFLVILLVTVQICLSQNSPENPGSGVEEPKSETAKTHTVAKPQNEDPFSEVESLEVLEQRINNFKPGRDATAGSAGSVAGQQFPVTPQNTDTGSNWGSYENIRRAAAFSKLADNGNAIEINMARVKPEKTVSISAGIAGILTRLSVPKLDPNTNEPILDEEGNPIMIEVKEGQEVFADQEIGTIDDSVDLNRVNAAHALLDVAKAESEKKIEIEYAQAAWWVSKALVEKNEEMNKRIPNTVSDQNVREAKLQMYQAKKQWEKAVYDLTIIRPAEENVKEQELAIAESTLRQRRLFSPVNGIVDQIVKRKGEWFREGDPILRITQFDTLQAVGRVSIDHAIPAMLANRPVTIVVKALPHQPAYELQGKVVFVDQTIQPDDYFNIHVEIKNEKINGFWRVNPGRFVDLKIPLN